MPNKPQVTFDKLSLSFVLIVVVLLPSIGIKAEVPGYKFDWVRTILGPCCGDEGSDLVVDSDGGVLVTGKRGGLDLDRDGSVDVQTFGSPDPLIFKTFEDSKKGWVQGPGGPKSDVGNGIAPDRHGGAYAVGNFNESMRIAGGTIRSAGKSDGFLVRYNKDGETQWAKPIGGAEADDIRDVASDSEGNIFIIGSIRGDVDLDRDGTIDVRAVGESALLLASFDPNGNLRWAHSSGGKAITLGRAIAIGPRGEIYVGGIYSQGAPDFNGDGTADVPLADDSKAAGSGTLQSDMNGFFARFEPVGKMLWVKGITGPAVQAVGSLAVIGNGDLIVLGMTNDSTDLDGDGTMDLEFKSMGDRKWKYHGDGNTFVIRVTAQGERVWGRRYMAFANHVAADQTRIVVSGSYNDKLDFDDDGKLERDADPDEWLEGFAAILDGEGKLRHMFTIVGGDSDVANAAGFSPDGKKLYVTGYTKLGADFDNDGKIESASACHQLGDVFLSSYSVGD